MPVARGKAIARKWAQRCACRQTRSWQGMVRRRRKRKSVARRRTACRSTLTPTLPWIKRYTRRPGRALPEGLLTRQTEILRDDHQTEQALLVAVQELRHPLVGVAN